MGYGAVPPKALGHPELRGAPEGNFFRLPAEPFLDRTKCLSAAERGIFVSLVALMAAAGKAIDEDPRRLTMACGCGHPDAMSAAIQELLGLGLLKQTPAGLWADLLGRAP